VVCLCGVFVYCDMRAGYACCVCVCSVGGCVILECAIECVCIFVIHLVLQSRAAASPIALLKAASDQQFVFPIWRLFLINLDPGPPTSPQGIRNEEPSRA
jgi:hypothetical protein